MESKKNYLIISDIHLGYRAKERSVDQYLEETKIMDLQFEKFIDYYLSKKKDQKWELIINGDFIDFIQINYRLNPKESTNYKLTLDDIKYGLNNKEKHAVWKLQKTVQIHPLFYKTLAKFVKKGNNLVIIKGNHDVELYWPKVKKELKNQIAKFEDFENDQQKDQFLSRIKIKDWIHYEKDLFYIEHGSQYDDYTSFNHFITPLHPVNFKMLETPFSHVSMRYWTNLNKDLETHDLADWGIKDAWNWMKEQKIAGVFKQFIFYFKTLFLMLSNIKFAQFFNIYIHLKQTYYIHKIASIYDISPKKLRKINRLKHKPIGNSVFEVLSTFYFELVIIGGGAVFYIILLSLGIIDILFSSIFFTLFSITIYLIFSSGRVIEPDEKLFEASEKISKILDAKYYIFGHTHHYEMRKISKKQFYINSGSWLGRARRDKFLTFNYNLFHIVIDSDVGSLELREWLPEDLIPKTELKTDVNKEYPY